MPPRRGPEPDDLRRRAPDRSLSSRIAVAVLVGGAAIVGVRALVATIVKIHGDGMAPSILDGDHVVVARGSWSVERGDVVIYDPRPLAEPLRGRPVIEERESPRKETLQAPDARASPTRTLPNTAVVDFEELEGGWKRVQKKSGALDDDGGPRSFRVGRVLAVPGDTVTFHVPGAALGIAVNGRPLQHKPGEPVRLRLESEREPDGDAVHTRATAYESNAERRYPVLISRDDPEPAFPGLALPPAAAGPVQIEADGYLVLADNRDEGACCDSRALGFVPEDHLRGEILARLPGDPDKAPDLGAQARGFKRVP